ncbi:MAG: peptide-methionine (S)-S-oxide reductase MsrA [Campylobacterales bacterium]|nr:peptide-methionine (S)-S-oxide reductase MsrA [Campylobacterales bacterium]
MDYDVITLGGGCFWCLEAVYEDVVGVHEALSGYMGGTQEEATYANVSTGQTGHAEVVQLSFNPEVISLEKILAIFWNIHDPTTRNQQGHDTGPQYRSVIFYHNQDQYECALHAQEKAQGKFSAPIVTDIVPALAFYEAEAYHRHYFKNNPDAGYCRVVVAPKVKKFQQTYPDLRR